MNAQGNTKGTIMKNLFVTATAALTTLAAGNALANPGEGPPIYGLQAEQLEYRFGEGGDDVLVWDFDAIVGDDELRFVFRSEAEMETSTNDFETLENQLRLQRPISTFFDAVVGARASTPSTRGGVLRSTRAAAPWLGLRIGFGLGVGLGLG